MEKVQKQISRKEYYTLASILIICAILATFYISYNLYKINKDGLSCITDPITYTEKMLTEQYGGKFDCECDKEGHILPRLSNYTLLNINQALNRSAQKQ
jgi:hypothetical protein